MYMKTQPMYLADSYAKEMDTNVLEVTPEGERRWKVLVDKTVFYPMGADNRPTRERSQELIGPGRFIKS